MDSFPDIDSGDIVTLGRMLWEDYWLRWAVIAFIVLWGLSRLVRAWRAK